MNISNKLPINEINNIYVRMYVMVFRLHELKILSYFENKIENYHSSVIVNILKQKSLYQIFWQRQQKIAQSNPRQYSQ